jgi:predicted ATPase
MIPSQKIVLTGGPGAGKTVVARAIAARHPERFLLVPEAATQVYAMLGTRWDRLDVAGRLDVQRRIYRLQVEQEDRLAASHANKALLLDRGTIDGAAYWPDGPDDYWRDLDTNLRDELARYDQVVWLETSAVLGVYDGPDSNFCRFEDAAGAIRSGELLKQLWSGHPSLQSVSARPNVADKVMAVESLLSRGARR